MPVYQVITLALVQAITEFLPISSTAHLVVVPWLFGWEDPGLTFSVALHVGTLIAVLIYFSKTWLRILFLGAGKNILQPPDGEQDCDLYDNPKLLKYLVLATFPAAIAGVLFEKYIENTFRSPFLIGIMLISVGLLIGWIDRRKTLSRNLSKIGLSDAMFIGFAQATALIPGTSRSGVTIAAALLLGFERASAARFSFLLSSPIILGAALKTAFDLTSSGAIASTLQASFLIGVTVSAMTGCAVIALLVNYLRRHTMKIFVYYRVIFGIIVLALVSFFGSSVAG